MTIHLRPETTAMLEKRLNTGGYASADDLVRAALLALDEVETYQRCGEDSIDVSARQLAALEVFTVGMNEWTSAHLPPGHETDDSRETIYKGRGG